MVFRLLFNIHFFNQIYDKNINFILLFIINRFSLNDNMIYEVSHRYHYNLLFWSLVPSRFQI